MTNDRTQSNTSLDVVGDRVKGLQKDIEKLERKIDVMQKEAQTAQIAYTALSTDYKGLKKLLAWLSSPGIIAAVYQIIHLIYSFSK